MIKLINNRFLNKNDLYFLVDLLRKHLGLSKERYPLDAISLAKKVCTDLAIEQVDFKTITICGILYKGTKTTSIALNSNRSALMQNFDCCHELIHYFCHDIKECQCVCAEVGSETSPITQNPFLEWQANEGAAELLVPYKMFIPAYIKLSQKYTREFSKTPPTKILSEMFNVTEAVISNRIESLNYELYQYMHHVDISKIEILSQRKQKERGWDKRHDKLYCKNCLSPIEKEFNYCPICGTEFPKDGFHRIGYILKGAGFMKYNGIKLNEHNRPLECPCCSNEEIQENSNYCMICGTELLNRCENEECPKFEKLLPGNARYCHICGHVTTYSNLGYLKSWDCRTIKNHDDDIPTGFRAVEDDDIPF